MAHEVVVGSDASCDFPVAFEEVYAQHCRLIFEDGTVWVEDLGSTNGTYLGGEQLAPGDRTEVPPGSTVSLARVATLDWKDIQALRPRGQARGEHRGSPSSTSLDVSDRPTVVSVSVYLLYVALTLTVVLMMAGAYSQFDSAPSDVKTRLTIVTVLSYLSILGFLLYLVYKVSVGTGRYRILLSIVVVLVVPIMFSATSAIYGTSFRYTNPLLILLFALIYVPTILLYIPSAGEWFNR